MTDYVRAVRAPDTTFRACGFRGCTSFASHVLIAGNSALCFCCSQCAAVGVKEHSGIVKTFTVETGVRHIVGAAWSGEQGSCQVIRFDELLSLKNGEAITFTVRFKRRWR
jgi:hypothetical protein